MPRISMRQRALRFVRKKLELSIALESSESDSDQDSIDVFFNKLFDCDQADISSIDKFISDKETSLSLLDSSSDSEDGHDDDNLEANPSDLQLYFVLYNTRYFVDRENMNKSKQFARQFFHRLPEKLFRQLTRMDKSSFYHLADLIELHPVFQSKSNYEQAPIEIQLVVCLDRLGHNGNGACLNHLIPTWGVSCGSLVNFSKRCFLAVESVLQHKIVFPTRQERQANSAEFAKLGFPGCIGLIDGTLLPLLQRPAKHGECYYDRKSRYSINVQVICDHRRKILFMFSGMPGTCSDLTCIRKSPMIKFLTDVQDNLLFDEGQFILGDSGYTAMPHMVAAFKKTATIPEKEDFNTCVAKCRVTNEHCIGVLKSRWHSLKEIRIQLNKKKDSLWMVRWISLCGKLHNYVMEQNDDWSTEDIALEGGLQVDDEGPINTERAEPIHLSRRNLIQAGNRLSVRVMDIALQHFWQPGHFLWHGP